MKHYVAVVGLVAVLALGVLFFASDREASRSDIDLAGPASTQPTSLVEDAAKDRSSRIEDLLLVEDDSGSADCVLFNGVGQTRDLSLVASAIGQGAMAFVVGGDGEEYALDLSFMPNSAQIARRSDGSVLYGLADLRVNAKNSRGRTDPEPIRIFHNDSIIYQSEKAFDFGVATDGSSYYVIEPTGDGSARMVLRNLDMGTEDHFDVGNLWQERNSEYDVGARYLPDNETIIVEPSDRGPEGSRHFYSAASKDARVITPMSDGNISSLEFLSATDAIAVHKLDNSTYSISRVSLDSTSSGGGSKSWTRALELPNFYGRVELSDDGEWIVVHAWVTIVLSADSGETVFRWPVAGAEQEERSRLESVIEYPGEDQDIGSVTGVAIVDGELRMHRTVGLAAFAKCHTERDIEECLEEARLSQSEFIDVFPMAGIQIDATPTRRVEVGQPINCRMPSYALGALEVVDGKVVYSTTER